MKTIITAAFLVALTAPAWASEPMDKQSTFPDEPVVLSEVEMDGVTAGGQTGKVWFLAGTFTKEADTTSDLSQSRWYKFSVDPN